VGSQNRADAKRQVIANEQWQTVQEEARQNEELLGLSHEILSLVTEVHALSGATAGEQTQNGRREGSIGCMDAVREHAR
jgi:hypothetical protein